MYCSVVIMSPPFSFEIKGKHRSKGAFVSPTMLYYTRSCKSSANGYEQRRRQIRVHEVFFLHQHPIFVSQIVIKNVTQIGATKCKTRGIVCKQNDNFLRFARNLDSYANLFFSLG